MGYESETDTFFYLSGIEGEDLSFMSFSYYPQDTQKDCNYLGKVRINLLPLPDSDFTLILPSCKVIICLHKLSPIPEPDVLVVKKGYSKPTVERLKNLTKEEWTEILKTMYWDRWKADEIKSQSVADILVDWVWASGAHGIKIPQRLLGVTVDGIVGPKTIAAVNSRNPRELFDQIKIARFDFIEDICRKRPTNNKFKRGWMNRINDISYVG